MTEITSATSLLRKCTERKDGETRRGVVESGFDLRIKRSNIAFAFRHPRQAALVVMYGNSALLWDKIAPLAGASGGMTREIFNSISAGSPLERHIRSSLQAAGGGYRAEVGFRDAYCLYTVCRLFRPRVVVETGVATGVSSAFILKALGENSIGTLHSSDLPKYESESGPSEPGSDCSMNSNPGGPIIPLGKKPGFVVPDELKNRWSLDLGPSSELLPKVLDRVGEVDLFFHDSLHTYENMTFEYEAVWPRLKERGLLLSHDVNWNSAFSDFGLKVRRNPVYLRGTGIGALKK